ncbi:trissin receptor [Hetaerina americana]|uniref:trissin receptor n=1 Tax=Hetaerina americana TaxID=62018 RepID=UPI003A7F40F1
MSRMLWPQVGNLLVILVVTLHRRLRSTTNLFLANLAVADLCVAVFCVYQNFYIYLISSWVLGDFFCKMYQFVHSLSYTASIFILVVICTERYFAIIHPITCKQILTPTRLRLTMALVWALSAAYSAPRFRIMKTITNSLPGGRTETICVPDRQKYDSEAFDICNFVLLYAIPLLLMTVLYARIALGLWATTTRMRRRRRVLYRRRRRPAGEGPGQTPGAEAMRMRAIAGGTDDDEDDAEITATVVEYQGDASPLGEAKGCSEPLDYAAPNADAPGLGGCRRRSPLGGGRCGGVWGRGGGEVVGGAATSSTWGSGMARKLRSFRRREGELVMANCAAADGAPPRASRAVLRARRGVVRMLVVVVVAFAACNLPLHARKMWQYWSPAYRGDSRLSSLLTPLTFLVSYANSGINPLLYAFMSRNFRKGMRELLRCSSGSRRAGAASSVAAGNRGGGGGGGAAGGNAGGWSRRTTQHRGWAAVNFARRNSSKRSFRRNGSTRWVRKVTSDTLPQGNGAGRSLFSCPVRLLLMRLLSSSSWGTSSNGHTAFLLLENL